MDLKSWIQMHIRIENICINSDMIENTFLWCILHTTLCSLVAYYIKLIWTVAYWCIWLHIDTYCFKMLYMYGHGCASFCTAAGGCIFENVHILLQIDANTLQYGRISLFMDVLDYMVTYGCIYIKMDAWCQFNTCLILAYCCSYMRLHMAPFWYLWLHIW